MWSSMVLFVLTFAVLGLLLGFAEVYNTNQEGQMGDGAALRENASGNASETSLLSGNPDINQESGQ